MPKSSLLRASDFCRLPATDHAILCRRENGRRTLPTDAIPDTAAAWASLSCLRGHAIVSGNIVEISVGSRTTTVRLFFRIGDDEDGDDTNTTVELSSVAWINLGLKVKADLSHVYNGRLFVLRIETIQVARKVTLRRWGSQPPEIRRGGGEGESRESFLWPHDRSLLHLGGLAVVSTKSDKDAVIYEVLAAQDENDVPVYGSVFLARTDETQFRLEQGPSTYTTCPILPNALSLRNLFLRKEQEFLPHPNMLELTAAFDQVSNKSFTSAELVWHLVGNQAEHHATEVVCAAAGDRRVLVIQGLAAYAYQSGRPLLASGGLADKITGLREAFRNARAAAPSLLLFKGLDEELCPVSVGQDTNLRHDQESRILSILTEELKMDTNMVHSRLPTVPSVLVAFSTRRPLPPGPLRQHLVWESIHLKVPDERYQRYLWEKIVATPPTNDALDALDDRPASDIEACLSELESLRAETGGDTFGLLKEICANCDLERRTLKTSAHVPSVHWRDIGGLEHVRREIMDAIELPLAHPHLFPAGLGRSGILLFGPPGTGKTMVAKAVATECELPFLSVKGPELLGSYVGESEANVRSLFQDARERGSQNKPPACVLFFDEMESLAPKRGEQSSGGNVMDRVVATLFTEMDRNSEASIFCIGATNRPDLLDPAMFRPGRFDRLVYLGIHQSDHAQILMAQLCKIRVDGNIDDTAAAVAGMLPATMTGADLAGIVSAAQVRATHRICDKADSEMKERQRKGDAITMDELLRSWSEDDLTPTVQLRDLLSAARESVPSVTPAELERYQKLKMQMTVD
jgi:AAA+ superfamily predicted ATPase